MTILISCRLCGAEYEPDRLDIVRGVWRTCPAWRPDPPEQHHCRACGRALRAGTRSLCLSCLGLNVL